MTQALIILKNGIRKYGAILSDEYESSVKFIPFISAVRFDVIQVPNTIEHIPLDQIFSIDTFLK